MNSEITLKSPASVCVNLVGILLQSTPMIKYPSEKFINLTELKVLSLIGILLEEQTSTMEFLRNS